MWWSEPPTSFRENLYAQPFVRQLEQRRVLTVSVDVGGDLAEDVVVDEGETLTLDLGETDPASATIDWGDGTDDQGPDPLTHVYADNGVYTVTVTFDDNGRPTDETLDQGDPAVETFDVVVNNVAPTLVVSEDREVDEGELLEITDIGTFTDPGFDNPENVGGEVEETFFYTIDWGDGTTTEFGAPTIDTPGSPGVPTAGSFDGSHVYADNGVYTVTVTVTDDDGGSTSETFNVTVNNVAPTLVASEDQEVDEGELLEITDIGSFTDPGFDNPDNVGGEVEETFFYTIDWGDGTTTEFGSPTIDTPGEPGVPTAGSFDGSHVYADNGVYTVTVTVTDDDGGSTSETFDVTVNNVAPTLVVSEDQEVDEGELLEITDIGSFTDPGFDNPENVGGEVEETFFYTIDWGDGTTTEFGSPTIDTPGSPGVPTAGSFDGSHVYADNGVYTVTVTVIDDDGGSTSETFNVTVNNVAPTLVVSEDQEVEAETVLELPDIGTFTDPGFDNPLNVGGEVEETFIYTIDWGDGTTTEFGVPAIDTTGSAGVLTAGSFDGSHVYTTPGVYTVTVTLSDDDGGVAVETFTVTVVQQFFPPETPPASSGFQASISDDQPPSVTPPAPFRPTPPSSVESTDFRRGQRNAIPVAEVKYVLRIVSPSGQETNETTLDDNVLENLEALYKRLPSDHYRIYLIRADGTERLILDVEVENGRPTDPEDASEAPHDRPLSVPADEPGPPAPAGEGAQPEQGTHLGTVPPEAPLVGAIVDDEPDDQFDNARHRNLWLAGGALFVAAEALSRARGDSWTTRVRKAMTRSTTRSMSKASRLSRQIQRRIRPGTRPQRSAPGE